MPTSFLVALGAVLLVGAAGFVVAWIALAPARRAKTAQLVLPEMESSGGGRPTKRTHQPA
jgi:hypothetical protein